MYKIASNRNLKVLQSVVKSLGRLVNAQFLHHFKSIYYIKKPI